MVVCCLNMAQLKRPPQAWEYWARHSANSNRAKVNFWKDYVAGSPHNVNLSMPCSVSCLPAALQVLSVTFELWAQLVNERNEGLDRKWQLEMSPSWMANRTWFPFCLYDGANFMSRAWVWSVIVTCGLINVSGYHQARVDVWMDLHRMHLQGDISTFNGYKMGRL